MEVDLNEVLRSWAREEAEYVMDSELVEYARLDEIKEQVEQKLAELLPGVLDEIGELTKKALMSPEVIKFYEEAVTGQAGEVLKAGLRECLTDGVLLSLFEQVLDKTAKEFYMSFEDSWYEEWEKRQTRLEGLIDRRIILDRELRWKLKPWWKFWR